MLKHERVPSFRSEKPNPSEILACKVSFPGLERLLRGFRRRAEETADQARRRFFHRVFGMWVSTFETFAL